MKLTLEYLYKKFDEFNEKFFEGSLPPISIEISKTKHRLGSYEYLQHRWSIIEQPVRIMISNYYDRPEVEICGTLIHEMIHYYLSFNMIGRGEDCHGPSFMKWAEKINKQNPEYNIRKNSLVDKSSLTNKNKIFRVLHYKYYGKEYFSRVSPTMTMSKAKSRFYNVTPIEIYQSTNPIIDTYICCSKVLRMNEYSEQKFKELNLKKLA